MAEGNPVTTQVINYRVNCKNIKHLLEDYMHRTSLDNMLSEKDNTTSKVYGNLLSRTE